MIRTLMFLCVIWVLGGCAHKDAFLDTRKEVGNQDDVIRELTRRNEELTSQNTVLDTEVRALRAEVESLRTNKSVLETGMQNLGSQLGQLERRFGAMDQEIQMRPRADGVAFEVKETLLFSPGKADLLPEGRRVLQGLAGRLKKTQGRIRVEGHTDNTPVRQTRDLYPRGNLELSGRRALEVAHFLVTGGGMARERVSFAGFGESVPVVANDSPANMSRNRRVEIVLLKPLTEGR